MKQDFGPPPTTEQILAYHRKMNTMKNHTNDCTVVHSGNCSCSFENQPGRDIITVLNERAALEVECEAYLNKIDSLRMDRDKLETELRELAEYPWGAMWTYWFTAMIAGGACMVGLIVGQWMFG